MAVLPPDVERTYSNIIDGILAVSDIQTISAKRIRKGLQEEGYDISDQKDEVTALIMERFDKFNSEHTAPEASDPIPTTETNGTNGKATNGARSEEEGAYTDSHPHSNSHSKSASHSKSKSKKREPSSDLDDESSGTAPEFSPPKKKVKKQMSAEDEDAAYAAKLQAEFNAASRARPTRGGATKKRAPATKKRQKKKSAARVGEDDDSELESGSGAREKKEVKRTGGFHKLVGLSPALQELVGETALSRPQIVKKIWEYIKANDLQEENDKRQIRCDDRLRAVFKQDRVHMFTMNKLLNTNLYALDEE